MKTKKTKQQLIIGTLADIRQDIKFYKLTKTLPEYVDSIEELKYFEAHFASRAYEIRDRNLMIITTAKNAKFEEVNS